MSRCFVIAALVIVLSFPMHAHAYRVPEREYWRAYVLSLINQSRKEAGLATVGLDATLTEVSQSHSEDTATHFNDTNAQTRRATYLIHVSSDHRTLRTRLLDVGLLDSVSSAGENVGFRTRGPIDDIHAMIREAIDLLHTGMMAELPPDDGHRKTILGDFTHVGVGLEFHKSLDEKINTLFFVTDFAKFSLQKPMIIPGLENSPKPLLTKDLRVTQEKSPAAKSLSARKRRVPTRMKTFQRTPSLRRGRG